MFCRILPLLILFYHAGFGQCKTFKISSKGDTLNCVDISGIKRGRWVIHVDALRGNPGYEEEGWFYKDKKEGPWRIYNLMGDKLAEETYKSGNKNGKCLYFTIAGLEREESWKAPSNPDHEYDTLFVQDPKKLNQYDKVVVKTEGKSIKHGTWKYYDPVYSKLLKTETYVLDVLQVPGEDEPLKKLKKVSDTVTATKAIVVPKPVPTPKFGQKVTKKKSNIGQ